MKSATDYTPDGRLSDVAYVDSMGALVVKFANGRVHAVPLAELEGGRLLRRDRSVPGF